MKLSQVVDFKAHLADMTPLDTALITYEKLGPILHSVKENELQFDNLTIQLDNDYQQVIESVNRFEQTIELLKNKIDQTITQLEPNYYAESFRLYSTEMVHDSPEYILNRRMELTPAVAEYITARIQGHGNWQHAGMIIRPGREEWINHLVGCDPLYLVDQHKELLEPAVLRFNDQYQRRLRTYVVSETTDSPIIADLPKNQFAYCLVYNFLNYKPFEIVCAYLKDIYSVLKPGGTLAMTINDCNRPGAVKLAEQNFMCYTPGDAITDYAKELGFEVRHIFYIDAATTWIELSRPGELTSLKGGQSLAKIVYKSAESMYTKEEMEKFKQQAVDLNIVHADAVNDVPIGQLIHEVKQRTNK